MAPRPACSEGVSPVGFRYEQNRKTIEREHPDQIQLRLTGRSRKFFPDKNTPQGRDHRRRLSDRVGNCYTREARRDQVEHHGDAPEKPAEESEQMIGDGSLEKARETYGFAYKRLFHEVNVPDEAGEECTQSEKYRAAIWTQRITILGVGHGARHEWGPQAHQNARNNADDDAFLRHLFAGTRQTAVGFAVEKNRDQGTHHTYSQEHGVSPGLKRVT